VAPWWHDATKKLKQNAATAGGCTINLILHKSLLPARANLMWQHGESNNHTKHTATHNTAVLSRGAQPIAVFAVALMRLTIITNYAAGRPKRQTAAS
jgi:hypothetical protein